MAAAPHRTRLGEVADELDCDETVARAMADRYLADSEARARKNQFSLFDL